MNPSEDLWKRRAIAHLESAIQLLELMGYLPVGRVINDIQIIKQDILTLGGPQTEGADVEYSAHSTEWEKALWRSLKRRAQ